MKKLTFNPLCLTIMALRGSTSNVQEATIFLGKWGFEYNPYDPFKEGLSLQLLFQLVLDPFENSQISIKVQ